MELLVVTLTYSLDADADTLIMWGKEFESHDGSVANIPGRGVQVAVWVEGFHVTKAPAVAADIADPVVRSEPVAVEVVTASALEVGEILGISRQRVHQLRASSTFPEPLVELRTGPVGMPGLSSASPTTGTASPAGHPGLRERRDVVRSTTWAPTGARCAGGCGRSASPSRPPSSGWSAAPRAKSQVRAQGTSPHRPARSRPLRPHPACRHRRPRRPGLPPAYRDCVSTTTARTSRWRSNGRP